MSFLLCRTIAILMCTGAMSTLHAGILYLSPGATVVDSGDTLSVQLLLNDNDGAVAAAGGLLSAGGRVLADSNSTANAALNTVTPNSAFDVSVAYPSDLPFPAAAGADMANLAGVAGSAFFFPLQPNLSGDIVIAEFDLLITGRAGSSVDLMAAPLGGNAEFIVGLDGTVFDRSLDLVGVTVTVAGSQVVPEPATGFSWSCLAALVLSCRCLKRRRTVCSTRG
jgi:hypothetical protein